MAMKRYSDEEREEAADACAMMASSDVAQELGGGETPGLSTMLRDVLEPGGRAFDLARSALWSVKMFGVGRERWAEAEARLRCGWTPGDDEVTR